ncbi:60S ribosomal protein L9B [Sarracenia purpurea var. burkii]
MKTILSSDTMDIPDGVKINVKAKVIEVEGPRGKLTRNFKHLNLDFQLITDDDTGKKKLKIESWFGSRKSTASIRTALSHVDNLIKGVTKGYRYKMRFVYAHFPINASITNGQKSIEIRNFLGEKKVRSQSHIIVSSTRIFPKVLFSDYYFGEMRHFRISSSLLYDEC